MKRLLPALFAIALFGFGCRGATPPVPTEPSPSPSVPSQETEVPDGWNTLIDGRRGFEFSYPATAKRSTSTPAFPEDVFMVEFGETTTHPTAKSVPDLTLHVLRIAPGDPRLDDCYYADGGWANEGDPGFRDRRTIAGREFCLAVQADAAAGNRYTSYNYAVPHRGAYLIFRFIVHSVECRNYEDPKRDCVPFDEPRDTRLIPDVLKTLELDPGEWAGLSVRLERIRDDKPRLKIDVEYPVIEGTLDNGLRSANEEAKRIAETMAAQFRKDAEEADEADAGAWTFDLTGEVSFLSRGLASVVFRGSEYTGGAHPLPMYATAVIDRTTGKALALADFFVDADAGLKKLAELTRAKIDARRQEQEFSDDEWVAGGTAPKKENYRFFGFTDDGFLVIIPPYQVGPYAAGPMNVVFERKELKGILKDALLDVR